VRRGKSKV
jgi:hypothetical protein